MSTGALLLPPGYYPLIEGAVVPSGKLAFYRTGTTTAQDTYTDANLSVANSNPVQLNATGGLDTLVYGDPSTGFRYRMRIFSSADVLLDTHDDLLVWGADTPTFAEGSFTGTLTGMSGATTGTVTYKIFANASGTGKVCVLSIATSITGTSNATAMTMTGLPAACSPSSAVWVPTLVLDSGNSNAGAANIAGSGTTITFWTDANLSATGFTNSGSKGIEGGWTLTYAL